MRDSLWSFQKKILIILETVAITITFSLVSSSILTLSCCIKLCHNLEPTVWLEWITLLIQKGFKNVRALAY